MKRTILCSGEAHVRELLGVRFPWEARRCVSRTLLLFLLPRFPDAGRAQASARTVRPPDSAPGRQKLGREKVTATKFAEDGEGDA